MGGGGAHYGHTYPFVLNRRGSQTTKFGKKALKIIDNFSPVYFFHPAPSVNYAQKSSRFWILRGLVLGESVKKGKFVTKIFFR